MLDKEKDLNKGERWRFKKKKQNSMKATIKSAKMRENRNHVEVSIVE